MKKFSKGFTLIELLVVIAIIGLLAAIVLASLNSARTKAADVSIKADISGVRSGAQLVFENNVGDYTNVCSDARATDAIAQATTLAGAAAHCFSDDNEWVAASPLQSDNTIWWCADYKGVATEILTSVKDFSVTPVDGDIDCD